MMKFGTTKEGSQDGPTKIKKITLTLGDGSETVINVSERLHYLFAFMLTKNAEGNPDVGDTLEVYVKGGKAVCSELYYQMGISHPEMVEYCFRKDIANVISAMMRRRADSDDDPLTEALKNMTPRGGLN